MLFLAAWLACAPSTPLYAGEWVEFTATPATSLHTEFKGQPAWDAAPAEAFALRDQCPLVAKARLKPFTETMRWLDLEGQRLDTVVEGAALLANGKYASIGIEKHDDGSLGLPVACASCEVMLAFRAPNGRLVACEGASRSIQVAERPGPPAR